MTKNTIGKLALFCLLLLIIRFVRTGHLSFFFLLWNLFLAWVPYWLIRHYGQREKSWQKSGIIGLTLLFLPNAPYILTDLFHLHKNLLAPMWYDLVLISGFSLLGLIFFLLTVYELLNIIRPLFKSGLLFNITKFFIFLSNGYGIYLGRYLRFNSWDIVYHPDYLLRRMFDSVFDLYNYKETLAVTFTFSIFLYLIFGIYESFQNKITEKLHGLP